MMRVSEVTRNAVVVLGGDSRPVRRTISTVGRGAMAMAPMASWSRLRSMAAANARRVRMVSACWWCRVGGRAADAAASLGEMLRWAVAVIAMASGAMEFVGVGMGGGWIVRSAMRSMVCVVVAAGSVSAEAGAAAAAAALVAVAMASRWVMSLCGSERGGAAMEEAVAVVSEMVEEHPAAFVNE